MQMLCNVWGVWVRPSWRLLSIIFICNMGANHVALPDSRDPAFSLEHVVLQIDCLTLSSFGVFDEDNRPPQEKFGECIC